MKFLPCNREAVERAVKAIPGREALSGKRILVTGASGLIGSSVIDLLLEMNRTWQMNIHITASGRREEVIRERFSYADEQPDFLRFDVLTDELSYEGDLIIHCAGNCSPRLYREQPVETLMGNLLGLEKVLQAAKTGNVKRVLSLSSSEVYGNRDSREPYREEDAYYVDQLNPRSCYPMGKRAAETLCASFMEEYGQEVCIVRPGHIYGSWIPASDDRAPAQFLKNVLEKKDIVMKSAGDQLRSYCHSYDCASAILTVLLQGMPGEAYNISNRDSVVTIREFAETTARLAGQNVRFENPTDQERKAFNQMQNSSLDASKLEALGWRAMIGLEEGVGMMLECNRF
ncbi:MAG: NAD(P)-dependent oxidoreductase [Eubacterium sp.]|nr:NAD(P)-dependent oxidoreductase [Eubacterium sp.]